MPYDAVSLLSWQCVCDLLIRINPNDNFQEKVVGCAGRCLAVALKRTREWRRKGIRLYRIARSL